MEGRATRPRADIAVLGVALAALVLVTWLSALPYISVRLGLPSPIALATVDVIHVYVGLASVVFLVAKVARVGFGLRVTGVTTALVWHRWVSWSLGGLYAVVYLTGILALPHWPAGIRTQLVNAHLIASVWAAVPTTWHVWHYRALARPLLARTRPPHHALRVWCALTALCGSAVAFAMTAPRAVAPLTQAGAGGTWSDVAPRTFLDKLEITPDGRWLVAGGSGLFVRATSGETWRSAAGIPPHDDVLGLDLPKGSAGAYVGTSHGLYVAGAPAGPYHRLPFPGTEVHGIAVDPQNSNVIWASSYQGFWRSDDGGAHWMAANAGVGQPTTAWGLHFFGSALLSSDVDAVYRWTGSAWVATSSQRFVVDFSDSPDGRVFASSMGDGIQVSREGRTWHASDTGIAAHAHEVGDARHVVSVTVGASGVAYAGTMLSGIAASLDGGSTWSPVWSGLRDHGDVWRVLAAGGQLVAATDRGIITYDLPTPSGAGAGWWAVIAGAAMLVGAMAVRIAAFPPWRGERHAPPTSRDVADRAHPGEG